MIPRSARVMLGLAAAILVSAAVTAAQYENNDLKAGKVRVQTVLILAPEVNLDKTGFKSTDPMFEASRSIEAQLAAAITGILKDHGYDVVADPFTPDALAADADLKYALADVQKQFDSLNDLMQEKSKDVRKGRFTMGDAVNKINPGGAADVLVFTRANGRQITGSMVAVGVLTGFGAAPYFSAQIGIVDAHTGNVLFYGKTFANQYHEQDVKEIFKKFPTHTNH